MGTQHMRTNGKSSFKGGGPIEYEAVPPAEIKAFPELLRRAGYFTTNNGKTDYQFGTPFTIWDSSGPDGHWRLRPEPDTPFFSMFSLLKTHEAYLWPEERPGGTELEQAFEIIDDLDHDLVGRIDENLLAKAEEALATGTVRRFAYGYEGAAGPPDAIAKAMRSANERLADLGRPQIELFSVGTFTALP